MLVNGDRLGEPNETFVVNLSNLNYGVITDGQGVGTIVDDEPRISISDVTKQEGKKGQTTLFTFTVTLSAAYDQAVTMSFATTNGTATTSDSDYVAKTGTLTFNPGETTKTITIEVKGDSKKRPTRRSTSTCSATAAFRQERHEQPPGSRPGGHRQHGFSRSIRADCRKAGYPPWRRRCRYSRHPSRRRGTAPAAAGPRGLAWR